MDIPLGDLILDIREWILKKQENSLIITVNSQLGYMPLPLQFNNVDARFWGFDMDWHYSIDENWSLNGLVNYVRGERDDIDDDLYRIAPPNTSLELVYDGQGWGAGVEGVYYDEQDKVSETNREQETDSYGLVHAQAWWNITNRLRIAAGADNLFDEDYEDHLAGYNRVRNEDIAMGARLPGYGRNMFVRMDYSW